LISLIPPLLHLATHLCSPIRLHIPNLTLLIFINHTATPTIYTLSLHDALPISQSEKSQKPKMRIAASRNAVRTIPSSPSTKMSRSEEHTSELQSHLNLVCRLLLEKKKKKITKTKNALIPQQITRSTHDYN